MYTEVIKTISSLFIFSFFLFIYFFLWKRICTHKNMSHLEVYAHVKNFCLCCLVLAYFTFVSWFLLVMCFCVQKIFSSKKKKKKDRLDIVLITSIYNTNNPFFPLPKINFFHNANLAHLQLDLDSSMLINQYKVVLVTIGCSTLNKVNEWMNYKIDLHFLIHP